LLCLFTIRIIRILNQFEPIENEDYRLLNVEQPVKQGRGGGVKYKKEYLIKYGVITTKNDSYNILRILNQFDPIENEDYRLHNVVEQVKSSVINV
jgi:hypothetical protein